MRNKLILALVCLLVAGCQAQPTPAPALPSPTAALPLQPTVSPTSPPTLTSTPQTGIAVRAEDLRGVKINAWHMLGGEQAKALQAAAQDFNLNNIWGIQVAVNATYGLTTLEELLIASQKDGKLPQVVLAPPEALADWRASLNIITDSSLYVRDGEWGLAPKETADFPAIYQAALNAQTGVPILRNAAVLFYNQSWAEELGFSAPPATPEAFRLQACAAAKANLNDATYENDGLGGWFLDRDPLTLTSWLAAFGAAPVNDSTGAIAFNTESSLNTFTFLRKLLDSACAWTSKTSSPGESFSQRRALFFSGTLEQLMAQERVQALNKSPDRWSVIAYPGEKQASAVLIEGLDGAILKGKPQEQLAGWLFLRWLLLPRSQAALASAAASLPVRSSALSLMADFARTHPQWAAFIQAQPAYKPAPQTANWRIARRILEDAAWQLFQPYVPLTRFSAILAEMDTTLVELLKRQP